MATFNVNGIFTSNIQSESDVGDESVGSNSGTRTTLATLTKTNVEWGNLAGWECVRDNKHNIADSVKTAIQTNYPNKVIDLDGIYIEMVTV